MGSSEPQPTNDIERDALTRMCPRPGRSTGSTAVKESALEQLFFRKVREAGGMAIKLMPTHAGVPDRLVLLPGGRSFLVELKTDTGTVSAVQQLWHRKSAELGHVVVVLKGRTEMMAWLESVRTSA
jgi:hypothetical protein